MTARRIWAVFVVAVALWGGASCVPVMRDYEGHTVFNPVYLFWLESPERDQWQKPDEVLKALKVGDGMTVADVGAGGGYFTERFSKAVGRSGRVYATDVQDIMIRKLTERAAKHNLENVTVVRAGFEEPALPAGSCDLVFFSSVYKEIEDRVAYLRKVAAALKPNGAVAIIEFRPETSGPGPPPEMRLTEAQVEQELGQSGFALAERHDFLPKEWFLVFRVSAGPQ
jgi:ubiquinone/menaquinone biosynthesis C-methylase UbiE